MRHASHLTLLLALAACGSPAENRADQLDEAADQSTPAAEQTLENAADRIEQGVPDPDATAQQALNQAGNAQDPSSQPIDDPDGY